MIEIEFLFIAIAFGLFILSYIMQSNIMMIFTGAILMIPYSIYISINGLGNLSQFVTTFFSATLMGVGSYISLRSAFEIINETYGG